jgi:CRP-like cAMP-binding protein
MGYGIEEHSLIDSPSKDFSHLTNERFIAAFNEVFEPLAVLERFALLEFAKYETYADGGVIINQGSKNQAIYVLAPGEVWVVQEVAGQKTEIARLGIDAVFGEISFIDLEGASASVIAVGEVEVLL